MMGDGELLYSNGDWTIVSEQGGNGRDSRPGFESIGSYIYHYHCHGPNTSAQGWCSAWDVRARKCFYCGVAIPESVTTIWLLLEGDKLGSYMLDADRPWNPPGRPS
jgi:hypothetical protein